MKSVVIISTPSEADSKIGSFFLRKGSIELIALTQVVLKNGNIATTIVYK